MKDETSESKYNIVAFRPSSEFKLPNIENPVTRKMEEEKEEKDENKDSDSGLVSILYSSIYDIVMVVSYLLGNIFSFLWMMSRLVWAVSMFLYKYIRLSVDAIIYVIMRIIDVVMCAITSMTLGA